MVFRKQVQAWHTVCPYFSFQLNVMPGFGGGGFWAGAANAPISERNKTPTIMIARSPEAEHVRQRLTAAELKLKLEPVFQTQGRILKGLIDQMADMSDEELAVYMTRLAQQIDEHAAKEE